MASHLASEDRSGRVLNNEYNEACDFPQFALLPWELRNQIWGSALRQRRLILVSLKDRQPDGLTEQELKDVKYGRSYLSVISSPFLSKLLRVNSEARNAALEFYRVRLPCVLDRRRRVGILPFNPEHDILRFDEETTHVPDFLSVVSMYDSRRVGLCNIAVSMPEIRRKLEADDPNAYQRPGFVEVRNNIREFYLITDTNSYALELLKERYNNSKIGTPITQTFSPLMSGFPLVPAFDLLPRDPRPIKRDLARLFLGSYNITQEVHDWKLLLRDWGIDPSQVVSRVLFVYGDWNPCLPADDVPYDESDQQRLRIPGANRVLHEAPSPSMPAIHLTVDGQEESESGDSVAFGFWMFPSDAFTEETKTAHPQQALDIWDLSDYWPELGLIHLPTAPLPK